MATTPDSGASHVGFRVAMTMEQWKAARDRVANSAESDGSPAGETGADPAVVEDSETSESADDRE